MFHAHCLILSHAVCFSLSLLPSTSVHHRPPASSVWKTLGIFRYADWNVAEPQRRHVFNLDRAIYVKALRLVVAGDSVVDELQVYSQFTPVVRLSSHSLVAVLTFRSPPPLPPCPLCPLQVPTS